DAASDVAEDVLGQLGAGTLPPLPDAHTLGLDSGSTLMVSAPVSVPEPVTLVLLGVGACLPLLRRRK
ncbi:hypothetical protein LCGC14_1763480, partial [marine sediment metagenome]